MNTLKIRIQEFTLKLITRVLKLKYKLLGRYYEGLAVQARYLYRQSKLYKLRWQEIGLNFADEMWEKDKFFFFEKARKENLLIRIRIFWDTIVLKKSIKELTPYCLRD